MLYSANKDQVRSLEPLLLFMPRVCVYVYVYIYIYIYIYIYTYTYTHTRGIKKKKRFGWRVSQRDVHYLHLCIAHCLQFEHSGDSTMQSYNV